MQTPDTVEVTTGENPIGSIIWLHGLGADGHDFEPIVPELRLPASLPLRFVFPHAPVQPVTINGGMEMRSWYDILSLDSAGRADFSQGGAVAVHTALNTEHPIAGLMALSTYLAMPEDAETAACRKDLPIFMAHGSFDPVLQLDWGRSSAEKLTENGYTVDWHEYPMAHAVCPQEIADISQWLSTVFS